MARISSLDALLGDFLEFWGRAAFLVPLPDDAFALSQWFLGVFQTTFRGFWADGSAIGNFLTATFAV